MPSSFFCKSTAANVWKSVTGVSAAGSRRGRGKGTGKAVVKDFNRGQQIGVGRKQLVLGGLNTPVVTGKKYVSLQDVGPNPNFDEKIKEVRKQMEVFRKYREAPLDRGWSGRRAHGRPAGPPDPYNDTAFEGFESTVLMLRPIQTMTGIFGRTRVMQALVAVGNKNGLAGFADVSGKDGRAVVRHARNMAAQRLVHIPRWQDHTVLHDFHSKYYGITVFVERRPKGYGLDCHRVLKAICKLFGITDLRATVMGNTRNQINLTRAFFLGLMYQRQYQDIANEKKLHLVELREENYNYPNILASPQNCEVLKDGQVKSGEQTLDFSYYINEGRILAVKPPFKPSYLGDKTWQKHLDRLDMFKNREKMKLELAAKYGDTEVLDVFPYFKTNSKAINKSSKSS